MMIQTATIYHYQSFLSRGHRKLLMLTLGG